MHEHAPVVLDIAGTDLTADDRRRLQHPLTGGLILFTSNWRNRAQLTTLIDAITEERPELLLCIDPAARRVQRIRNDCFHSLTTMQ